jgi:crossover junction endodeoxyribonuclease RuvC
MFEMVRRHKGTIAAHMYGGIMHKILEFCDANDIPYGHVEIYAIKREATGKGRAEKEEMIRAAKERWPDQFPLPVDECNDNQADACWGLAIAYRDLTKLAPVF